MRNPKSLLASCLLLAGLAMASAGIAPARAQDCAADAKLPCIQVEKGTNWSCTTASGELRCVQVQTGEDSNCRMDNGELRCQPTATTDSCTMIGNVFICSSGLRGTQIGNVWYFNNGARGTQVGNAFDVKGGQATAASGTKAEFSRREDAQCARIGDFEFCAQQAR